MGDEHLLGQVGVKLPRSQEAEERQSVESLREARLLEHAAELVHRGLLLCGETAQMSRRGRLGDIGIVVVVVLWIEGWRHFCGS